MLEEIYFVDEDDNPTGETSEKFAAHHSNTKLHAAFSCYVFNHEGKFLTTQRAHSKLIWPAVWTNSCCGHPAPGESREDAITRRLDYELGMRAKNIQLILPGYSYTAPPYNGIIENEFCPLYVAVATSLPRPNSDEVAEYKWIDWESFIAATEQDDNDYSGLNPVAAPVWSWWCKDQLKQLKDNKVFGGFLNSLQTGLA